MRFECIHCTYSCNEQLGLYNSMEPQRSFVHSEDVGQLPINMQFLGLQTTTGVPASGTQNSCHCPHSPLNVSPANCSFAFAPASKRRVVFHRSRSSAKCCFAVCPRNASRTLLYRSFMIFQVIRFKHFGCRCCSQSYKPRLLGGSPCTFMLVMLLPFLPSSLGVLSPLASQGSRACGLR